MPNLIKILIVEDDPFIAQEITDYLYDLGYAVAAVCRSVEQAKKVLARELPDLVLLDIELEGKENGVDLAIFIRHEKIPMPIVYLTSQTDARIIASVKTTRPDGFIVKPFDERDLATNIEIALFRYSQGGVEEGVLKTEASESFILNQHYFVKSKNNLVKINPTQIIWAEADDNYTHLWLEGGEHHLVSSTLKQIEEKLPVADFIRIHRTYLINLQYLEKLEDQYVHLGKKVLPIGKSYKQELMKRLSLL